jgi:hypothetical protein
MCGIGSGLGDGDLDEEDAFFVLLTISAGLFGQSSSIEAGCLG